MNVDYVSIHSLMGGKVLVVTDNQSEWDEEREYCFDSYKEALRFLDTLNWIRSRDSLD